MDLSGVTQFIAAIFGAGGVAGAIAALSKAYRSSIDRAKKQARIELLQEQSAGTIATLKQENGKLTEENEKWKALWEAGEISAPQRVRKTR